MWAWSTKSTRSGEDIAHIGHGGPGRARDRNQVAFRRGRVGVGLEARADDRRVDVLHLDRGPRGDAPGCQPGEAAVGVVLQVVDVRCVDLMGERAGTGDPDGAGCEGGGDRGRRRPVQSGVDRFCEVLEEGRRRPGFVIDVVVLGVPEVVPQAPEQFGGRVGPGNRQLAHP